MTELMIDIETLSTHSDAAVVSIGYAAFDRTRRVYSNGLFAIRPQDWHGHIDPQTIKWWMGQSTAAKISTFSGAIDAKVAALDLRTLIGNERPTAIWANDPSFDVVILKNWWRRLLGDAEFPISFRLERSCRTLFDIAKRYGIDYSAAWSAADTAHDAMVDATSQARAVLTIQDELDRLVGYQREG